jgi:PAS domain S-box-containing protein
MSTADRSQLLRVLQGHRDAVVDSWYKALTRTDSFAPLKAAEVRQRLVELTDQAIALLLADPFERSKAQAIGAALARLRCVQPEALGRTQEILAHRLVEGLLAEQVVALQPRLAALLGGLAAGFFQQACETILAEQERIRDALVTELQRAEESLRESEQTAWVLLNAPTHLALLADPDGTIVALNEAACKSLGKSSNELVGTCVFDLFTRDVVERRKGVIEKVIHSGKPARFEDEREGRWFDQSVYPVFGAQGNVVQLAVFARDITERKRAEQQAIRAERLAAMGWLATALAHDINTPLQAIRSNLELALDFDLEPDEHKDCLQVVRQEVERLAEITRRVLDFAQPADDTRYPVSIARLTQKTLRLIGKQLALAHVRATTDFPADLPSVFVAPDQIVQVLLNLSINAIEAMPDGGHLHITGRVDGDTVALTLANDGPPFPAEHIERIFDPFFTTKQKGTGLGLPISHSIVHRHGGTISVENLEGDQGVAFTVTLPIIHVARLKEASA